MKTMDLITWLKPKVQRYREQSGEVDPHIARLYAENDAHLIIGVHVPGSLDKAVQKSIERHEGLHRNPCPCPVDGKCRCRERA